MYVEEVEKIKRQIQDWAATNHSDLRIGWGGSAFSPRWFLTRLTLPAPHLLCEIQFTELESMNWTEEEYFDQLRRYVDDVACSIAPFNAN